jgi:hypothetical protein
LGQLPREMALSLLIDGCRTLTGVRGGAHKEPQPRPPAGIRGYDDRYDLNVVQSHLEAGPMGLLAGDSGVPAAAETSPRRHRQPAL